MTEPENFLTRWSRRKAKVEAEQPDQPALSREAALNPPAQNGEPDGTAKETTKETTKQPVKAASAPAEAVFDPASLPPLDSIGAQTDISAFLKPGVPGDLKLAALRRAWTADPAIRDFKGLAEYDWDFTDPNAMTGFGNLDPGFDSKKMVAQLFGEKPRVDAPATEIPPPAEQPARLVQDLSAPEERSAIDSDSAAQPAAEISQTAQHAKSDSEQILQRNKNIASHDGDENSGDEKINRRRSQGGALPQ
ncbi:MAG: DUF3306 domain-containing protein [Pseudolabrys sp.]